MQRLDRVERLTNLVLVLLDARRPLTLNELADAVGGYPEAGEARRRSFERDKQLLRAEGVPIQSVAMPGAEQYGYVIPPELYYLPDLGLSPDEQLALNLAASAVRWEGGQGSDVTLKLGLFREDNHPPAVFLESLPWLAELEAASRSRSEVRFPYRSERREVEPYAIASKAGRWYLVGRDRARGALRRFRVDRIEGRPEVGPPGAFEPPAGLDVAAELPGAPWEMGEGEAVVASVAVSAVVASEVAAELGSSGSPRAGGGDELVFDIEVVDREAFRFWVLGWGQHAEVLSPPELREDIISWLSSFEQPEGGGNKEASGHGRS